MVKKKEKKGTLRNIVQSMKKELDNVMDSRPKLLKRKEEIVEGLKVAKEEEEKMKKKISELTDIKNSLNKKLNSVNKKISLLDKNIKKIHDVEKDLKESKLSKKKKKRK